MLLMQKAASRQAIANKGFMVPAPNSSKKFQFIKIGVLVCEEVMNIEGAAGLSPLIQSTFNGKTRGVCVEFSSQNKHDIFS